MFVKPFCPSDCNYPANFDHTHYYTLREILRPVDVTVKNGRVVSDQNAN